MDITFRESGDIVILNFAGRLDLYSAQPFRAFFEKRLTSGKRKYAVDLTQVDYIDSSGFGALIGCVRDLSPVNGTLVLFGMAGNVEKVFKMTRLHKVIGLYATEQEAIAYLESVLLPPVVPRS